MTSPEVKPTGLRADCPSCRDALVEGRGWGCREHRRPAARRCPTCGGRKSTDADYCGRCLGAGVA